MTDKKTDAPHGSIDELDFPIAASAQKPSNQRGGLIERTITRLLMRPAHVTAVTRLSEHFRIIDLQGNALKDCTWSPGDKVQVKLDGGLITRTYTPIEWDRAMGRTRIVSYCHGDGLGSEWSQRVTVGDQRQLFGPRGSMDLSGLGSTTTLFGDETSFGLAVALERHGKSDAKRHFVFEVNDRQESASVLLRLGLPNATLIERLPKDVHLQDVSDCLLGVVQPASTVILTGKASSIQHARRTLQANGFDKRYFRTKVYWAPGKIGLD